MLKVSVVLRSQKRSNSNEAGAGRPNKLYNEFQFIVSVHVGTLTVLLGLQRGKKIPVCILLSWRHSYRGAAGQPGGDQTPVHTAVMHQ